MQCPQVIAPSCNTKWSNARTATAPEVMQTGWCSYVLLRIQQGTPSRAPLPTQGRGNQEAPCAKNGTQQDKQVLAQSNHHLYPQLGTAEQVGATAGC
jgi:hypothetical protein